MNQILSIQVQDSETGEWKTVTSPADMKGFNVDLTPTGFVVENYTTGKSELTMPLDIPPKIGVTIVIDCVRHISHVG